MPALVSAARAAGVPARGQCDSDRTVPGRRAPSTTAWGRPPRSSAGTNAAPSATRGSPPGSSASIGAIAARGYRGCDTAPVDFVVDNAVALSAIFLGAIVLIALAILAVTGLRLWRRARAAQKRVGRETEVLAAQADRLSAALDAMPQRQAELQYEIRSLQGRIAALQVLARHASEAQQTLRAPLRYFTG